MRHRRKEIRKHLKASGPWYQRLIKQDVGWTFFYVLIFALIGGSLAIYARTRLPYYLGQQLNSPIVARADFSVVNDQKTQELQDEAVSRVSNVYRPNAAYVQDLSARLIGLGKVIADDKIAFAEITPELVDQFQLTEEELNKLRKEIKGDLSLWESKVEQFIKNYFSLAILDDEHFQSEVRGRQLMIQNEMALVTRSFTELFNINDVKSPRPDAKLYQEISKFAGLFDNGRQIVTDMVTRDLRQTVIYDETLTQQAKVQAASGVEPHLETYASGDIFVQPRIWQNRQSTVGLAESADVEAKPELTFKRLDQHDMKLLAAEQLAYETRLGHLNIWLHNLGMLGIYLILGTCLWTYVWFYSQRIARNPLRGLVLSMLVLLGFSYAVIASAVYPQFQVFNLILPVLFVSGILVIAYEQRLALAVGAMMTLMFSIGLTLPHVLLPVLIVGIAVMIMLAGDVSHRSTLVKAGFQSGLAMAACYVLAEMIVNPMQISFSLSSPNTLWWDAMLATGTGLFVGMFIHGLLPWIEQIFSLTTSMTLRELNDASHPLLRKLAQDAPGTYQHSLRIADMAEEAARAIGGNPLLCRVGAMYHDIGKTHKPHYFIENQGDDINQHEYLSPAMSLLIILGHVKDGVEMAKEYHLPREVIHFIESHHGTTLVEYFYHAAIQQTGDRAKAPEEYEFRYPGPKPRTREAAIMMIADAAESASRAMENPTATRLQQLVHDVALRRLMDGQFDECQLTLKELNQIEATITRVLCAANHGRIQYPGSAKPEKRAEASKMKLATNEKPDSDASSDEGESEEPQVAAS